MICQNIDFKHGLSLLSQGGTARLIVSGENQPIDNEGGAYWTEITMKNVEVRTLFTIISDADEYFYDSNGNMTEDLNKNITDIQYNYLNLPETVNYIDPNGASQTVTYTYNAAGIKLKKETTSGETIDYIGGIHYRSGALDFVQHAEGKYLFASSTYQYNLTDHLGNVRANVDASGSVVQADDYMPFGLTFNSSSSDGVTNKNLYKFTGMEQQEETGMYDFNARMYDPWLGRFANVDPHADSYHPVSPYNYAFNNPLLFVDPTGMDGTMYLQILTDEEGNVSDETLNLVNNAVNKLIQNALDNNIDITIKMSVGNEIVSKSDFEGKGYETGDSYTIIGTKEQLESSTKEAASKGCEDLNEYGDIGDKSGTSGRESENFSAIHLVNVVKNGRVENATNENYATPQQKMVNMIMHEVGHDKFGRKGSDTNSEGHTLHRSYNIMHKRPKKNATYNAIQKAMLQKNHGTNTPNYSIAY